MSITTLSRRAWIVPGLAWFIAFGFTHFGLATEIGSQSQCSEPRRCCCCPDDYCPKLPPCVMCAPLGKCDDYCPKPLPCTAPLRYCGPNDYCPKPSCLYLPPCWPAWYSCRIPEAAPATPR